VRRLHIAPGDSAGGCLRMAVREAGCDDDVLSCGDNLSCGPIASDDLAERAEWWGQFYDDPDIETNLKAFWDRVSATEDRLVVWFGRYSASELAFFHVWVDRLGDRPFGFTDVTSRQASFTGRDGTLVTRTMESVGIMNPEMLRSLFGSEQPATLPLRKEAQQTWRRLKAENAPFRIATDTRFSLRPSRLLRFLALEAGDNGVARGRSHRWRDHGLLRSTVYAGRRHDVAKPGRRSRDRRKTTRRRRPLGYAVLSRAPARLGPAYSLITCCLAVSAKWSSSNCTCAAVRLCPLAARSATSFSTTCLSPPLSNSAATTLFA